MNSRFAVRSAVLGLLLCVSGCSSKGTVSGKVTYKGNPVTSGSVSLIASDDIQYASDIGPDGSYSIPNVPGGPVRFFINSPNPNANMAFRNAPRDIRGENDLGGGGAAPPVVPPPPAGWVQLPDKYSDPEKSELTGNVSKDTVINLVLE